MRLLIFLVGFLALNVSASRVTVWNLTDGVVTVQSLTLTNHYAVGVLTGEASTNWVTELQGLFGTPSGYLSGGDLVLHFSGDHALPVVRLEAVQEPNMWPATLCGMGAGFLWFGFGWILRLNKKVGDF